MNPGHFKSDQRRRGTTMVYAVIISTVIFGITVLSVDVGRVMVAKSELQTTANAAARYAAAGMAASSTKATTAYNQANTVCSESRVDGRAVTIASSQVQLVKWDTATRTYTVVNNESQANAVRVTVTQTIGGANSAPTFAQAVGLSAKTLTASSIAMVTITEVEVTAPSKGNLWLSGAADNTSFNNLQSIAEKNDNSGTSSNSKERPAAVSLASLGLQPGDTVTFEGLDGQANNGGGATSSNGPDGNLTWNVALGNSAPSAVPSNSANGISNMRAPISSCIAVFLSDSNPSSGSAPSCLDFATTAQRDYTTLSPALKQSFYVGDGKTSWGEVQHIVVPAGATRVFLGMMDAWQWNDNVGNFKMKFYRSTTVTTVK